MTSFQIGLWPLTNDLSIPNLETFKVEKKSSVYPRIGYELADKQKGGKDALRRFILFLITVAAIYSPFKRRVLCTHMVSWGVNNFQFCSPEKWTSTLIMRS